MPTRNVVLHSWKGRVCKIPDGLTCEAIVEYRDFGENIAGDVCVWFEEKSL